METATRVNEFYVTKIDKLREASGVSLDPVPAAYSSSPAPRKRPQTTQTAWAAPFSFHFATAGRVAKFIKTLNNRQALGVNGIPVSILLADRVVPRGFKLGIIHPVFKGGGKCRKEPGSYRPISILPAMSKVLEIWVKTDLEAHLATVNRLPQTQFGFRPKRSCATALSHAQAGWLHGVKAGKVVGVMAFDLSAAFNTVSHLQQLPKLSSARITGRPLAWLKSYLTGGRQQVDWDGAQSNFVDVKFGVRQGSILGPLLFLVHAGNMQEYLGIGNNYKVLYADDTCLWCYATSLPASVAKLNSLASRFSVFAGESGHALNAGKMQLLSPQALEM
jgi:hypothetical protein